MSILGSIYGNIAYYHHSRGDFDIAENYYEKALANGMKSIKRRGTYAVLVMRKGEFERSIQMFDKLILERPPKEFRIKIRLNRAIAYTKAGRFEEAKVALEDIHASMRSVRVYESLGYLYVIANDPKAEEYNLEAYDYDSTNSVILDNLTQYYLQNNDYIKARKFAEKAYEENDNQVDILYHLTLIEEHAGNINKAKEYADKLMDAKLTPMNDVTKEQLQKVHSRVLESAGKIATLSE
jgi:tetratricopeptide (TPR) repeat protein